MRLIRKPKYKAVTYAAQNNHSVYGISKRFFYFLRLNLYHKKIVQYKGAGSSSSYEALIFPTADEAAFEIDKLIYGAGEITQRYWKADGKAGPFAGKCVRTVRRK